VLTTTLPSHSEAQGLNERLARLHYEYARINPNTQAHSDVFAAYLAQKSLSDLQHLNKLTVSVTVLLLFTFLFLVACVIFVCMLSINPLIASADATLSIYEFPA
jgi:hypothetical protein